MGPREVGGFQQLKNYIATNLLVTVPKPETPLLLYVVAFKCAVSAVLVHKKKEQQGTIQRPVNYVSEALSGAKINYTKIKKIAYAVLTASRKLKHYY